MAKNLASGTPLRGQTHHVLHACPALCTTCCQRGPPVHATRCRAAFALR